MFRDREEELDRLEAALLEQEEEVEEDEEYEEDEYEEEALPDFDAYNADVVDEDLEEFSETVYQGSGKSPLGFLAVLLILVSGLLLGLAWFLLKQGGYLG